uniref:F-box domain-containing protein n=1 Tax=Oryza punctata TaxID=4537 RepID=A0A0E0JVJ1_ORYPU
MADGMVVLLPDDLLANVLRRLPPRTLAVSRCVCAEWRALIDDRRLLRTHLLPLRLEAFFFIDPGYTHLQHPYFFSPPSTARRIGGRLDFLDTFHTLVFSSRKWRWEERTFVCQRGGEPGDETIADLHICPQPFQHRVVYLKGEIYVHCINDSLMRIILSNDKYQMIKSPVRRKIVDDDGAFHLGKCDKGIYFALLWNDNNLPRFQVWLLNESLSCCGQMEWMPKTNISLEAVIDNFPAHGFHNGFSTSWIINYLRDEAIQRLQEEDELEWDFENGTILETKDKKAKACYPPIFFLGFHPYKEIAFFWVEFSRAVSYHLNTSKVQELGGIAYAIDIEQSFPYTPCWMELTERNN